MRLKPCLQMPQNRKDSTTQNKTKVLNLLKIFLNIQSKGEQIYHKINHLRKLIIKN